eukprot:Hpha_TRINITY_DN16420_c2_g4::TRINITY_DN16420_c2_g4_i1::g.163312::m.163312
MFEGEDVAVVGQDRFWERAVKVTTADGRVMMSQEEPECSNHGRFAAAIRKKMESHRVVVAEGFLLLHDPEVSSLLTHTFYLHLDKAEAGRRRTDGWPEGHELNRNPLSPEKFEQLLWPAHQRYLEKSVLPRIREGRVHALRAPGTTKPLTKETVDDIARFIVNIVRL